MTHADPHAHGHHEHDTEGPRPYFPEPEWEEFKKDDIKAGTAIILEMAGIFFTWVLLYAATAFIWGKRRARCRIPPPPPPPPRRGGKRLFPPPSPSWRRGQRRGPST